MKFSVLAATFAMLATSGSQLQAQNANTDNSLPESMRIQQSVTERNERDAQRLREQNARKYPDAVTPSGDNKRIDPAAPSPQRLRVGPNVRARVTPGAGVTNPGISGNQLPANSSAGTGAGTSGASGAATPSVGTGVGGTGAPRAGITGSRSGSGGSRGSSSGGSN